MRCVVLPDGAPTEVQKGFAQILAVHAALLPTGKILYFSGDQHDPGQHHHGLFDQARLFNCSTLAITAPAPSPSIKDLFCCGHAFLADGRLLVAGGTEHWVGAPPAEGQHMGSHGVFKGTPEAYVFDLAAEQWIPVARMIPEPGQSAGGGRWYPTLVTLGNGEVAAFCGPPCATDSRHFNDTIEVYSGSPAPQGQWTARGTLPAATLMHPMYPRLHLLKGGTVFVATSINGHSMSWNPATGGFATICPGPGGDYDGYSSTSVLLPLLPQFGYATRVLVASMEVAKFIDLEQAPPSWQPTGPRTLLVNGTAPLRSFLDCVLLPTGDVLVCNGITNALDDPNAAVLDLELYHPLTNSWSTVPAAARAQVPRNYHSVALLMPDGRVWMAGSSIRADWGFHNAADHPHALPTTPQDAGVDNRELRIELFEPWYFNRPDRPVITTAPASATVGTTIEVSTPHAAIVKGVALIRAGSCTHSFNSDQRYVGLTFTKKPGGLTVTLPANPNLLPPGPYLLFLLATTNAAEAGEFGIPSVGRFILINAPVTPKLTLQLNASSYRTGETMTVVATLTPGAPNNPVDAYVVARLPNGQFLSAQLKGPPVPGFKSLASNIVPIALQQQVVQYTFAGNEPAGNYTWMAVLTQPGTQNFVSALEEDPFTFAP